MYPAVAQPEKGDLTDDHPQPAKKKLRACRVSTYRAKILKLLDGTKTAKQIKEIVKPKSSVMAHAYCNWRDLGVGYAVDDDGGSRRCTRRARARTTSSGLRPKSTDARRAWGHNLGLFPWSGG
jgi:hypothetical protein